LNTLESSEIDAAPVNKVSKGAVESPWQFRIQVAQLLMTTALFAACVYGVVTFHQTTDAVSNKVDTVLNEFIVFNPTTGDVIGPSTGLSFTTARLLSDSLKIFFLGSNTGSLAQFVQASLLTQNIAAVATAITPLATSIRNSFNSSTDETNLYIASYADLVVSIMDKVRQWQPLTNSTNMDSPAFSDGIFRLDGIIDWVKTQGASGPDLRAAGTLCGQFLIQLGNINWSGTYQNRYGNRETWDANYDIRNVIGDVQPVCQYLAQMQTDQS